MNKTLNLEIGTEFGGWLIISTKTKRMNNLTHWKCRCFCGAEEYIALNNLMNESSTQCQTCANKKSGLKKRKGVGDLSGDHWARIRSRIKKKNPEFSTRIETGWEKFLEQRGKCFYTGKEITLSGYPYDSEKTTAEFVIVNGNIQVWVHSNVAKILTTMSSHDLITMAFDIVYESDKI